MPSPALPGHRFAYEADGTFVTLSANNGAYVTATDAQKAAGNDEDADSIITGTLSSGSKHTVSLVFPELRDILGLYAVVISTSTHTPQLFISLDTSNGVDGTWTQVTVPVYSGTAYTPEFRTNIAVVTGANGVKGARVVIARTGTQSVNYAVNLLHLYGRKSTAATGLELWHPTLDQAASFDVLDFGDALQGSTILRSFRVKNRHATLTANTINVSAVAASNTMGLSFALGAGAYGATAQIPALAPGSLSDVITARRQVPALETVRAQAMRVSAVATSWS